MKKFLLAFVILILCAAVAGETYYIVTNPIIDAYALSVDGAIVGYLASREEAEDALEDTKIPYVNEKTLSCEFVETVEIYETKILKSQLSTSHDVWRFLIQKQTETGTYTVCKDDTWSEIAKKHHMTTNELMAMNPFYVVADLAADDILRVEVTAPFLSIMTVEPVSYTETVPYTSEDTVWGTLNDLPPYVDPDNYSLYGYSYNFMYRQYQLRSGRNGLAEVTDEVTFINGVEHSRKNISYVLTSGPVSPQYLNVPHN